MSEVPALTTRSRCPVCENESFTARYQAPLDGPDMRTYLAAYYGGRAELELLAGAQLVLVECDACGLIYQRQAPNQAMAARLYGHWIDPAESRAKRERRGLRYHALHGQTIMRLIALLGRPPSELRFLDYGMGWGKWALLVRGFGCQSAGLDLSEERQAEARANGLEVIDDSGLDRADFDLVNVSQVFEHLTEPRATIQRLAASLRPGGIVRVAVPTAHDIKRRLAVADWMAPRSSKNSLHAVAPLEHLNLFNRSSLRALAAAAGLHELTMPLRLEYAYTSDWSSAKRIAQNLLQPLAGRLRPHNHILFQRPR